MALHQGEVVTIQQPIDLLSIEFEDIQWQLVWPLKTGFLQSLHPQNKAIAFPADHLHQPASSVTEDEQSRREWIQLHLTLNDSRQAINRFTHVYWMTVQTNALTI